MKAYQSAYYQKNKANLVQKEATYNAQDSEILRKDEEIKVHWRHQFVAISSFLPARPQTRFRVRFTVLAGKIPVGCAVQADSN